MLNENDQKTILNYARAVLEAHLQEKSEPVFPSNVDAALFDERRGIFVTLKIGKQLRGCIGQILGYQPLRESLPEMTCAAAFGDPRFPPVTLEELKSVKLHISLLTVPKPVRSFNDIRLGTDGIIVTYGRKKGVYLPEVATETGWSQKEFFTSCALEKAGLSANKMEKALIEVFQTEGFEEEGYSFPSKGSKNS